MNGIEFAIRRVARSFGLKFEMGRRMAITRELQLLAEAESILGRVAWPDVENIQEIAEEFYQIRDYEGEIKGLRREIRTLERENDNLLGEQERLEEDLENQISNLVGVKSEQMQNSIASLNEIENLKMDAEITRKKYSGVKLRLKSLTEGGAPEEELEEVRQSLVQLKEEYSSDTKLIVDKQEMVQAAERQVTGIEDQVTELRSSAKERITQLMNENGKSANLVARYGAKLGGIEKEISDLSFSIGSFLSNNSDNPTPEIKQVVRKHRGIIGKIESLKKSINYNRILSGQEI